jgi:hypothetical protein
LATFATTLQPLLNVLDGGHGLRQFFGFMSGWAGVTQQADGLGHFFNLRLSIDPKLLTQALTKYAKLVGLGRRIARPSNRRTSVATRILTRPPALVSQQATGGSAPTSQLSPAKLLASALAPVRQALAATSSTVKRVLGGPVGGLVGSLGSAPGGSPPPPNAVGKLLQYLLGS